MQALGQAIVRRRESLNWTSYRLSQKAGVDPGYLRDIERGNSKRGGVGVIARIAHALGMSTDMLLAEAGAGILPDSAVSEAEIMYGQLDAVTRPAWLRMGHTLREIQEEYAQLQADDDDGEPEGGAPVPFRPPVGPKPYTPPPAEDVGIPEEDRAASQEPREEDGAGDAGADIAAFSEEELAQEARREAEDYESG